MQKLVITACDFLKSIPEMLEILFPKTVMQSVADKFDQFNKNLSASQIAFLIGDSKNEINALIHRIVDCVPDKKNPAPAHRDIVAEMLLKTDPWVLFVYHQRLHLLQPILALIHVLKNAEYIVLPEGLDKPERLLELWLTDPKYFRENCLGYDS